MMNEIEHYGPDKSVCLVDYNQNMVSLHYVNQDIKT